MSLPVVLMKKRKMCDPVQASRAHAKIMGSLRETGLADLPDEVLGCILEFAGRTKKGGVHMRRVAALSSVCRRWLGLLRCCYTRVRLTDSSDVKAALKVLQTCKRVSHVELKDEEVQRESRRQLLAWLANSGCSQLTSLTLHVGTEVEDEVEEALSDVALVLQQCTSLQELHLEFAFCTLLETCSKSFLLKFHAMLHALDFGKLVRLKKLTLVYQSIYVDLEEFLVDLPVPVNESLAHLPELETLHLTLPAWMLGLELPEWLGRLKSFASLTLSLYFYRHHTKLLSSLGVLSSLQTLIVDDQSDYSHRRLEKIPRLPSLTTLRISCQAWGAHMPEVIYSPGVKQMCLSSPAVPVLDRSLPALEELELEVLQPGAPLPDFFERTPRLRSLRLRLRSAAPSLILHPLSRLTTLIVGGFNCFQIGGSYDSACLPALKHVTVESCSLLSSSAWLLSKPGIGVLIYCSCGSRPTVREFCSYAEYARQRPPCRFSERYKTRVMRRTPRLRGADSRWAEISTLAAHAIPV